MPGWVSLSFVWKAKKKMSNAKLRELLSILLILLEILVLLGGAHLLHFGV